LFSNLELRWPLRFLLHHPANDPALTSIDSTSVVPSSVKVRWTGSLSYSANVGEMPKASGHQHSAIPVTRLGILSLETLNTFLPIEASPAIFIRYKTHPHLVNTIISSPVMEVRQNAAESITAPPGIDTRPMLQRS